MGSTQKQINIRLEEPLYEWLEAAAFVHRRSVSEELRAAVDQWLDGHGDDPRVKAARELRDPDQERAQVSSLTAKRQQVTKIDSS